jgi:hypothetical protein
MSRIYEAVSLTLAVFILAELLAAAFRTRTRTSARWSFVGVDIHVAWVFVDRDRCHPEYYAGHPEACPGLANAAAICPAGKSTSARVICLPARQTHCRLPVELSDSSLHSRPPDSRVIE